MVDTTKKTKTVASKTKKIVKTSSKQTIKPIAKVAKTATTVKKTISKPLVKTVTKPVTKVTKAATIAKKTTTKPVKSATTVKKTIAKPVVKLVKKPVTKVTAKSGSGVKRISSGLKVAKKSVKGTTNEITNKIDFLSSCSKNLNFLKSNFLDISLLFKNFIHWNISKVLIFSWSIILGFLSIIPLLLILILYSYFTDVNVGVLINGFFNGALLSDILGYIILGLTVILYIIVFSYSNILLINVNNSYKEGKKLSFKENDYFNFKKIIKFFNLSLLNISILLIPVILFVVLFSILIGVSLLFFGDMQAMSMYISSGINYLAIVSLLLLLAGALLFGYLYYRVIFSYFVFSDKNFYKDENSALFYVKESFNKTKKIKNFFKIFVVIILFVAIVSPINYVGDVLESNGRYLNDYKGYLNKTDEQKRLMNTEVFNYYESLKIEFKGLSANQINTDIKTNYIYLILFSIFNFIFLYGLFVMIFSSFYKRELV